MNENEKYGKCLKVFMVDDMADIYIHELQPLFKNVIFYNANTYIDNIINLINDNQFDDKACLLFDATYYVNNINDYAISYAEHIIRQQPEMESRILTLLGEDIYIQFRRNSVKGSQQAKAFLQRLSKLPYTMYTNKIHDTHNRIVDIASSLNIDPQSVVFNTHKLPQSFQDLINELYSKLLNVKNFLTYSIDIPTIFNSMQPLQQQFYEHEPKLCGRIDDYRTYSILVCHDIAQYLHMLSMAYNAKPTSTKIIDTNTKRTKSIKHLSKNFQSTRQNLVLILLTDLKNIKGQLKSLSDNYIPPDVIEFFNNMITHLIKILHRLNEDRACVVINYSRYYNKYHLENPIFQSGEDE